MHHSQVLLVNFRTKCSRGSINLRLDMIQGGTSAEPFQLVLRHCVLSWNLKGLAIALGNFQSDGGVV